MANLSVEAIEFKNGQSVRFSPGDIVLVVGRNSSGKSTLLQEIFRSVKDHISPKKLIANAKFRGTSEAELKARFHAYFNVVSTGGHSYVPNDRGSIEFYIPSFGGGPDKLELGRGANAYATLLNAEGRLSLTKDVETVDIYLSKPKHPFHVFMVEPSVLKRTSDILDQSFGVRLAINRIGDPIRGYVGPNLTDDDSLSSDRSLPDRAELLVHQGDGLRSFAGIVGEIEALSHPLVLIDEPEAFLHPPQAKRLGKNIVASLSQDRQAFVATHNSNFLQGAIANLTSRLRVLRLERNNSSFRVIDIRHDDLKQAETLPSIANTNLLDSLFYDQTVICEADADCKLFERLLPDETHDRFWFSCGGKQQFQKVAGILNAFGVDWRAVLDLDVLLDWQILESLARLKGLNISQHKKRVNAALKSMQATDLGAVRLAAASVLTSHASDQEAIRQALRELDARKTSTPLKQHGLSAVPKGQERQSVEALLDALSGVGILLLRKGELESYVPTVGGHGPSWVNAVLLNNNAYSSELSELTGELRKIT